MELLNTVKSILNSPSAFCFNHSREVISWYTSLHLVSLFLIRHTNTLRLNSVWCKHFKHLGQKATLWMAKPVRKRIAREDRQTRHQWPTELRGYVSQKLNRFDTEEVAAIHVLQFSQQPGAWWIIYNNKTHTFFLAASSQSLSGHTHCNHVRQGMHVQNRKVCVRQGGG